MRFPAGLKEGCTYVEGGASPHQPGRINPPGRVGGLTPASITAGSFFLISPAYSGLLAAGSGSGGSRLGPNPASRGPDARCQGEYSPSFESIKRAAGSRGRAQNPACQRLWSPAGPERVRCRRGPVWGTRAPS